MGHVHLEQYVRQVLLRPSIAHREGGLPTTIQQGATGQTEGLPHLSTPGLLVLLVTLGLLGVADAATAHSVHVDHVVLQLGYCQLFPTSWIILHTERERTRTLFLFLFCH